MRRYLLATGLLAILAAGEVRGQCNNNQPDRGWLQGAPGLRKYEEASKDTRQSDENLTIMLIVGAAIGAVVVGAAFVRQTMSLSGPRPRHPWDA